MYDIPAVTGINLTPTSVTITQNNTVTINRSFLPVAAEGPSTWSSGSPIVASISQTGIVTPLSYGTTEVRLELNSDSNVYGTSMVTVAVPVSSISLDRTHVTFNTMTAQSLTINYLPLASTGTPVEWISENSAICTVNQIGVLMPISPGITNIVTRVESDHAKSATTSIFIAGTYVTGITLPEVGTFNATGTHTVTPLISPSDAMHYQLNWDTSDPSVFTVNNGVLTILDSGTAILTATLASDTTVYATTTINIDISY